MQIYAECITLTPIYLRPLAAVRTENHDVYIHKTVTHIDDDIVHVN